MQHVDALRQSLERANTWIVAREDARGVSSSTSIA
jgi:hypothetical protein